MNQSSPSRLMQRADLYLKLRLYTPAFRALARLHLKNAPAAVLDPAIEHRLTTVFQCSEAHLSQRYTLAARCFCPDAADPLFAFGRLYLPSCSAPALVRQLVHHLPHVVSPLAQVFAELGDASAAHNERTAARDYYQLSLQITEAAQNQSLASCRGTLAAVMYLLHQYDDAVRTVEPCYKLRTPPVFSERFADFADIFSAELLIPHKPQQALELLEPLCADHPNHPGRPSLARALEALDRFADAAACWYDCAQQTADEDAAYFIQKAGDAYRRCADYDSACACYQQVRQLAADQSVWIADAWIAEGLCYYAQSSSTEELSCYRCALQVLPADDVAHRIRPLRYCADTEFRTGLFEPANAHYAEALAYAKQTNDLRTAAQIEFEWADCLREYAQDMPAARQHYHNAIPAYRKLLDEGEDVRAALALAYNGRGICAFHEKDYENQIADSTQAITLLRCQAETPEMLLQLSACLRNRGDSHDQLEQFTAARINYTSAADAYEKACKLDPSLRDSDELLELLLCCGRMCDRMERYDESTDYYTQVLELLTGHETSPTRAEYAALASLRRGYARMRNKARNFTLALQDFHRALTASADSSAPNMLRIRASAYRQSGELYAAMEQYSLSAQAFAQADRLDLQLQSPSTGDHSSCTT